MEYPAGLEATAPSSAWERDALEAPVGRHAGRPLGSAYPPSPGRLALAAAGMTTDASVPSAGKRQIIVSNDQRRSACSPPEAAS
eukprot:ctg_1044.g379